MKAMEYCDGCKLARMAVDCYQRESHEFCGVFCMATGFGEKLDELKEASNA